MAETTAYKNERINDFIADATAVSLHSADPGTTGANELTGGSPAYARKTPSWTSPTTGNTDLASALTFDVGSGSTVSHYGLWKAGTFIVGGPVSGGGTYSGQGTFALTGIPVAA